MPLRKGVELRRLCGFADVAWSAFDALEIDAVEEHEQVGCQNRDAGRLGLAGGRESERSPLQPFVKDQEAVVIPEEQLDPIPATIPEDEVMTGQGVFLKDALHEVR